jgi:hypothetical protein
MPWCNVLPSAVSTTRTRPTLAPPRTGSYSKYAHGSDITLQLYCKKYLACFGKKVLND